MIDLKAIRERAEAATPGPWEWRQCYEMGDEEIHWAIESPSSKAEGKITNTALILDWYWATDGLTGKKFDEDSDLQFIAHAREDIPALLAEIDRQAAEIESLRDEIAEKNRLLDNVSEYIKNKM